MRLLINADNESIFLPPSPTRRSELDQTSDLLKFRQWLHDYQPGFRDLAESEQQQQVCCYYDQYIRFGRLPLLPVQIDISQSCQPREPNAKVKALVHNLETRLVKAFLYNSAQTDWTSWIRQTITELIECNKIDLVVADHLTYPLTRRANKLIGMHRLHHGLWYQSLEYTLYNQGLPESEVGILGNRIKDLIRNNHRYTRIFRDPGLVEELLQQLDPDISYQTVETRNRIRRSLRLGCQRDTLVEMIYTRSRMAISCPVGSWSRTYTNVGKPKSDSIRLESIVGWEDDDAMEEENLSQSRLSSFGEMTDLEKMEWYMRFFMPQTTLEFYTEIKEVVQYVWHPEALENLAIRNIKRIKGRCTSKDLLMIQKRPLY